MDKKVMKFRMFFRNNRISSRIWLTYHWIDKKMKLSYCNIVSLQKIIWLRFEELWATKSQKRHWFRLNALPCSCTILQISMQLLQLAQVATTCSICSKFVFSTQNRVQNILGLKKLRKLLEVAANWATCLKLCNSFQNWHFESCVSRFENMSI